MVVVYGEADKPRVLTSGFGRDHPFAAVVEKYAGYVHYLDESEEIRWESFDALVVVGNTYTRGGHLRVLQIGGRPLGQRLVASGGKSALTITTRTGDEVVVPDSLPEPFRDIVKRELLPLVSADSDKRAYEWRISPYGFHATAPDKFFPLLHDLDGYAFGAIYSPPAGVQECIYLPEVVEDITPWLLAAFARWAEELPEVFPSEPEWTDKREWMTGAEIDAASQVEQDRAELDRRIAEAEKVLAKSEKAFHELREQVDSSERRLLTSNDDPLVEAVTQALKGFGFTVTNVDATLVEGQAKKEDLRVTDGEWVALAEVKGYTKGGKLTDISKLQGTHAPIYATEAGKLPDAMWYIVNQWRETDPSNRPQILKGADEFVETFGSQGGLVLDTRELFRLAKAVDSGMVPADQAREMLKGSTGRFRSGQP